MNDPDSTVVSLMLSDNDAASPEVIQLIAERVQRSAIRQQIAKQTGDIESQLGILADNVQLLMVQIGVLTAKLSKAVSFAEVRDAASHLAKITETLRDPALTLPFQAKGEASVIDDLGQFASAVAEAITTFTPENATPSEAPASE